MRTVRWEEFEMGGQSIGIGVLFFFIILLCWARYVYLISLKLDERWEERNGKYWWQFRGWMVMFFIFLCAPCYPIIVSLIKDIFGK